MPAIANLSKWILSGVVQAGNQVLMDIEMTSGGIFDAASVITRTDPPGSDVTILLTMTPLHTSQTSFFELQSSIIDLNQLNVIVLSVTYKIASVVWARQLRF